MTTGNDELLRILTFNKDAAIAATRKELDGKESNSVVFAARLAMNFAAACMGSSLKRIRELESRLVEIEKKGINYTGTWQRASDYGRGAVTTHKGSAWACVADTTRAEPGASGDWQLMVKRGDDGRDAR